jgi:multidrug efflux system outer membrane protein
VPPADLPAPLPLDAQQIPGDLPAGLPSDLLVRRPDLRAAEQQLLAANANIGAARAAFFPRISLTANFGSASSELDGLFKSGTFAFTGTAQLLQPIFDHGRNRANLDVAQVNRDIAIAQYERSIQNAFREVSDALAGRATLGEQLRAQAAQVEALAITFRLADLRYRAGAASFLDILDAQRSLFAAQQALVQTRALRLQNLVTLYRVLGGGWAGSGVGRPAPAARPTDRLTPLAAPGSSRPSTPARGSRRARS